MIQRWEVARPLAMVSTSLKEGERYKREFEPKRDIFFKRMGTRERGNSSSWRESRSENSRERGLWRRRQHENTRRREEGGGDLLAGSIRGSALAFISIVASSSSRAAFSPGSYSGSPLRLNGRSSRANRFHKPDRLSPGRFRLNRSTFKSCVHEDLPFQRLINWPLGKRKLVSLPDPCLAEFRFQIFLIKLRSFKIRRIIIYIHINVLFARTRRGFVSIPLLVPSYWDFVSSAIEHF